MTPRFVYWWAKGDVPGSPAVAGGFLRCDTPSELEAFVAQCEDRRLAYRISSHA